MSKNINIGDKVCYSANYLRSTGQYTGDIPFARGIVTELKSYGDDFIIATIDWEDDRIPVTVNVENLSRVTEKGIVEQIF